MDFIVLQISIWTHFNMTQQIWLIFLLTPSTFYCTNKNTNWERERVSICVCLSCSLEYTLLIRFFHVANKYIASFPKKQFDHTKQAFYPLSYDWKCYVSSTPVCRGGATGNLINETYFTLLKYIDSVWKIQKYKMLWTSCYPRAECVF